MFLTIQSKEETTIVGIGVVGTNKVISSFC